MMTVKIDKYALREYKGNYYIFNRVYGSRIVLIEGVSEEFGKMLGEAILKELNTGKYEEDEE